MPGPPPTSNNRPHEPLWALRGRRGSARLRSSSTSRSSGAADRRRAPPVARAPRTRARRNGRPRRRERGLASARETSRSPSRAPPQRSANPESASRPLGTSSASTGAAAAFIASIAARKAPLTGRARPVPSSASTITSAPSSARPRTRRTRRRRRGSRRPLRRRALEPLGRHDEQHAHRTSRRLREPREHEAVAGVVAGAAHDAERTSVGPAAVDDAQAPRRSAAHELVVRDAASLDRPPLQLANLRGAEDTLGKAFCQGFSSAAIILSPNSRLRRPCPT